VILLADLDVFFTGTFPVRDVTETSEAAVDVTAT
jgi:hypothetical protein